jgi:hypothetical protein
MESHKFIFIAGVHRSGTTILSRLLREQPEISGFEKTGSPMNEGQHLQNVYPPAKRYGGPGLFAFNENAYLDETSEIITEENKKKLFEQWSKHWDITKPFLLEKSPPNIIRTRFLQEMFPNSYFIIIKRHPIAVAMATNAFASRYIEIDNLIEHWVLCHEKLEKDLPYLKNVFLFKYEDFVSDTSDIFNQMTEFLGCSPIQTTLNIKSDKNEKYIQKWDQLPDNEKSYLKNKYEDKIKAFGYSFDEFTKEHLT